MATQLLGKLAIVTGKFKRDFNYLIIKLNEKQKQKFKELALVLDAALVVC